MLEHLKKQLAELLEQRDSLFAAWEATATDAKTENRNLNTTEQAAYDEARAKVVGKDAEIDQLQARIKDVEDDEARAARVNEARALIGAPAPEKGHGGAQVTDPPVYVRDGKNGNSYFRDLGKYAIDGGANVPRDVIDRLTRNAKATQAEKRALGNTNAAGGSGGEFAPPDWLVNDFLALLRAGRVTANLFNHMDLPDGVSSINLPKVSGGTTTAVQTTQNTALSQTDMTTTYVQTGFATIGGKEVVSQQLLDQSAIPFDQVILGDLAADYGLRVGTQIYTGTGTGSGTNSVVNGLGAATYGTTTTWTQASPTVAGFYGQATKTLAAFLQTRYAPPTCWLMSPRRWYWLVGQTDTVGRPLVVPQGNAFNPIGTMEGDVPQGLAGYFLGLPVYIDPNAPINLGAGTNQDNVYLIKQDDLWLIESAPKAEAFRETYADSVGVLFRMYGYVGTILNRYTQSIAVISGTGLVTPTFAS